MPAQFSDKKSRVKGGCGNGPPTAYLNSVELNTNVTKFILLLSRVYSYLNSVELNTNVTRKLGQARGPAFIFIPELSRRCAK